MILHIFAKDWRKLWPWVLGLALLSFYLALAQAMTGPFPLAGGGYDSLLGGNWVPHLLGGDAIQLGRWLPLFNLIGLLLFFLTVRLVQLDPIPGERQDWLARPVPRRDLLAAKLLFVVVLFHGPMLAADLYQGLALGFPVGSVLAASLSHTLMQFATISLPALAVGALTRSIGQALGLGLATLAGALALAWAIPVLETLAGLDFVPADNGVSASVLKLLPILIGGAIILRLQYFLRATRKSQAVLAISVFLCIAAQALLPQGAALAMDRWLSGSPRLSLSIAFAPDTASIAAGTSTGEGGERSVREGVAIYLPLRVSGVPAGATLTGQSVRVRLVAPDGKKLLENLRGSLSQAQTSSAGMPARGGENGAAWNPARPIYLRLILPKDFFAAHAGQPLRLELDFSLIALHPLKAHELKSDGGEIRLPDIGWCATRFDRWDQLQCLNSGPVPAGFSAQLISRDGKALTPERLDTPPGPERQDGTISRWGMTLLAAPYENSTDIPARPLAAKLVITAYEAVAQSVQHVTIAQLRLGDWAPDEQGAPMHR